MKIKAVSFLLILILALALTLRLHSATGNRESNRSGLGSAADSITYHNTANNLYHGRGYSAVPGPGGYGYTPDERQIEYHPAMTRGPVYPYFLYLIYKFSANGRPMDSLEDWRFVWDRVRVVQSVIDTLSCLLVFLIVRQLFTASAYPALTGALLYAVCPSGIYYSRTILTEALTTFLVTLFLFFLIRAISSDRTCFFAAAAAVFGLLVLGRKEYLPFLLFLLGFFLYIYQPLTNKALRTWGIFLVAAVLFIVPWTVRNYVAFKKPIVVYEGNFGYTFLYGTFMTKDNVDGAGRVSRDAFASQEEWELVGTLGAVVGWEMSTGDVGILKYDALMKKLAMKRIAQDPWKVYKNWIRKIPLLWRAFNPQIPVPVLVLYLTAAFFALIGNSRNEYILFSPIVLLFVYINLLYLPLYVEARYTAPVMPGVICLASIGVFKIAGLMKPSHEYHF